MKKTLVIGASPKPERYAYKAVEKLRMHGHEVVAVGRKQGKIGNIEIQQTVPQGFAFHTVTLYVNPANQQAYYKTILALHPDRIIFNPGTENPELQRLAAEQGIETIEACTLVLLSVGAY
jgi:hypothetical protein